MEKWISSVLYFGVVFGGMLILLTGCGGDGDESGTAGVAKPSAVVATANITEDSTARSTVNSTANQATLSWRAPATRVNGDALSGQDLASYEIRYGTSAENLNRSAVFDGAAGLIDMSYTIENLSAGTWYFTIQARDDNGLLSSPSVVVSKNIPG
ncbi:fibronectin type III domain-containing protein [Marinobacter sp. ELB17]|uniref:fibronectin type III domain-containing protein n=1 Tax=Marinobacter sp. ELB17 TaxID=270374 RepID=UPI0000F38155|nr:fibronectin type III domain-containing protein [Marinobacter sp. ELB17]EAZ99972.1 hypothetical protein MELB17_16463 [Marinobacter sp. ELB17]